MVLGERRRERFRLGWGGERKCCVIAVEGYEGIKREVERRKGEAAVMRAGGRGAKRGEVRRRCT